MQKHEEKVAGLEKSIYLFMQMTFVKKQNMVGTAYKNRTRDEIIAAFHESIRRKREWQERAEQEIRKIHQERLQLSI